MKKSRESRALRRSGFTMAEALIAMAIVIVLAAAAIPGGMGVLNNVRQLQLNRSAETIYMTAQRNLIAAKVSGKTLSSGTALTVTSEDDVTLKNQILPADTITPALYAGRWAIVYDTVAFTVTRAYYSETEDMVVSTESTTLNNKLNDWNTKAASATGKVGLYGKSS